MSKIYESMVNSLTPLQIYNISQGSLVNAELLSYCAALDDLEGELDGLLKEMFITTAESYGIENYEKIWGAPRNDLPLEKRKEMILKRLSTNYDDFSLAAMEEFLLSLNMDARIIENPADYQVYVDCNKTVYTKAQRKWIEREIKNFFPAHLHVYVDFRTIDWDDLDALKRIYNNIDNLRYTWDDIENYSID